MDGASDLEKLLVAIEIEQFVNGDSNGALLLQALYGATADEPIPERLMSVLRRHCCSAKTLEIAADALAPVRAAAS
jgi:hypothetical protein